MVAKLRFAADVHYNMDSVVIANAAAKNSKADARAVIIRMSSFLHKTLALVRIKLFLYKYSLNEISAGDSFPNSVMQEAKWLNRFGASMKIDKITAKY